MANRHLSRSIVLQSLFEWDLNAIEKKQVIEVLDRNIEEFAPNKTDRPFMGKLLEGILGKQPELDLVIEKAAPEWPIDRISPVDRNILRLGLFELLFADRREVPAKVAINEAIELAKQFGGENSSRFVNGVLGAVYKEIGEPGKEEVGKIRKKDVPFDQMPIERLGGAVVYAEADGVMYLALVHDIFGHWTLSKGKIGDRPEIVDETSAAGTIREIKEEMGLDITIEAELGNNEYVATHPEKGKVRKQVHYYLASAPYSAISLEQKGGLDDGQWFRVADILDLNFYEDILPIVTKAITMLVGRKSK
ncbi:transcription antitermination factor NusB [Candidatus Kaiserbacteria bacterium RIFOXYD1_FULL_42_15]|uniref:Transcription antitermination protein NusB n=1 Tax=Candidatus Kaiserbacteria bacterium RIFOXYD1_FULL_42_15 TaxID=1798532 RepID=A0A1F6FQU0_9BACT|nr:MAG: transcription antitermination factor NusB [Candidatus Kaiserbacteria bacterium RIFOXYD1_FULL_42_15]